jgi:hypothetical protein
MKFKLICEEPNYMDFLEFKVVKWEGCEEKVTISFYIKTNDGKIHPVHLQYKREQLKDMREFGIEVNESIDTPIKETQ